MNGGCRGILGRLIALRKEVLAEIDEPERNEAKITMLTEEMTVLETMIIKNPEGAVGICKIHGFYIGPKPADCPLMGAYAAKSGHIGGIACDKHCAAYLDLKGVD